MNFFKSDGELNWKEVFHDRFVDKPLPLLIYKDAILPAASFWIGMRYWINEFRNTGLSRGDSIILADSQHNGFPVVLFAALWEGISVFITTPSYNLNQFPFPLPPIVSNIHENADWMIGDDYLPINKNKTVNSAKTPGIAVWLLSSGTSAEPKWIGLSEKNIFSVISSHLPVLDWKEGKRVLSTLPFFHCFGLVMDLCINLFSGLEIVRIPGIIKESNELSPIFKKWDINYFNAVPSTIDRINREERGSEVLRSLEGGIIGGAPVSKRIADALNSTKLQVGYGQTEASPGIMLGRKGEWEENIIGFPLGCEVKIEEDGNLYFRGENAYSASIENGRIHYQQKDRFVNTGDRAIFLNGKYFFDGRDFLNFKLSNGVFINVYALENRIKIKFPEVEDVLIYQDSDDSFAICYYSKNGSLTKEILIEKLGNLFRKTRKVTFLEKTKWVYTPKMEINRQLVLDLV